MFGKPWSRKPECHQGAECHRHHPVTEAGCSVLCSDTILFQFSANTEEQFSCHLLNTDSVLSAGGRGGHTRKSPVSSSKGSMISLKDSHGTKTVEDAVSKSKQTGE